MKNTKDMRAQASIEYLALLAIALTLCLIGLYAIGANKAPNMSEKNSIAYWQSTYPITIVSAGVANSTTLVLTIRNNCDSIIALGQSAIIVTQVQ